MVRSVMSCLSSTAISFSIKTTEFQRPTTRRLTGRVLEKCSWNLTFQLKSYLSLVEMGLWDHMSEKKLSVSSFSRYSVFFKVFWIERAGCEDECVILVTATEFPDDMKSMAVEAILLLQEKINDDDDEETVKMQLLVPSRVIGCVIGRSGSVITQIRKRTNASIRISKGNNVDLVEVIMILTKVQIFSPSPFVSSVPEYASIDFDQRRETWESSLGMVSSDRFYGYESSFPLSSHFEFF
ncbi:hypothetical protein DY000_02054442 [Brassica cretica]|uniref:K Homology domain-containing protein n=1 Tax=Brassica cretica TaxID=69181 RepID=A0ABQ7AGT1_BRACR|nr:hypothetical protein DY000_02054442 [Brassica cretica]